MKKQQYVSYLLILIGSITAIYGQSGDEKNVAILIIGIIILMYGIYRISSKIPSKFDKESNDKENEHEDI
ncbi:hypothetical protein ACFPH8_10860 [Bizionia hallyeonensis]|uniref:Uncharacterized protein n=1 Tax=Bizionia hallyeonensis TaxID=1123757 RepID=A0ABW0C7D5_9FLAO|nr:hypothetical protein [Bizionia sp. M204]UPS90804.1 hypothetical protein GMA17_03335 [Bizionia sp. M204]